MGLKLRPDGMLDPKGQYLNPLTGKKYDPYYTKLSLDKEPKGWALLQAYKDRNEILQKIHSKSILLVSLPTGTGKTVIVPRLLFHYFGYDKKIIVTTPRQATTEKAGEFAAVCFNVPLFEVDLITGKEKINPNIAKGEENRIPTGTKIVGYSHGDNKEFKDNQTKLLFTTDASVKSMIVGGQPNLENYNGIVIDEVHERSVSIDIVISLVMDILTRRKDFKIIFMSATMDLTIFTDYFKRLGQGNNYNIYTVPEAKTTYNIDYKMIPEPLAKNPNKILDSVYDKINEVMAILDKTKVGGDILVFVTSDGDIKKIQNKINQNIKKYSEDNRPYAVKLSSGSTEDEKNIAINKDSLKSLKPNPNAPKGYARKIIIATPMAESSITFKDKLTYVIDTGLAYSIAYDAEKYCYVNGKNYVRQANIEQRCGRTGRNCDGTCIQLYTKDELLSFPKYTVPEIRRQDFTKELLSIITLPTNKLNAVLAILFIKNMIEPVDNFKQYLKIGMNNIKEMDFIDAQYRLTDLGNICSEFGKIDIKIAKMIIGSYFFNCMEWSIMLGAILHLGIGYSEMFKQLNEEDKKDPKKKKKYEDNVKRFIKPEGDHISLLIIYYLFLKNNPASSEFAEKNSLDYFKLTSIQKAHNELLEIIYKQDVMKRVNILSKFNTITSQFNSKALYNAVGGGKEKTYNTKDKSKEKSNHKSSTDKSSTKKINKYNKYKYKYNIYKKNALSRKSYKRNIQNNSSSINLFNKNNKNDRTVSSRLHKHDRYRRKKNLTRNTKNNKNSKNYDDLGLQGGGSLDIHTKRRIRYMELFTLYNLQSRKKSISHPKTTSLDEIFTRIIACLYYGYSTNIASYSGTGKDYFVKFSNIQGTPTGAMSKTTFDFKFPNPPPDFLIYNNFSLPQEFGKFEKKGNLSLISKLEPKHLDYFFDLKEIQKQVMLEIK